MIARVFYIIITLGSYFVGGTEWAMLTLLGAILSQLIDLNEGREL